MAYLKTLSIKDFRNIEKLHIDFKPGYNLLIGENGQGKTNLLEAIYFISLLRSFRTSSPSILKRWNCKDSAFYLKATVSNRYLPI
ncbi:MAG: AAA family ATPase, partial [Lentisphaeria bacterium]